ncbi:MAG TPA: carboxyl transferase domain-containing protein, partial [Candidatus Limnocylindria bacterium]|nr:carboxyl transferase domain-containing protein [Candidatus Limnocylindria bacterium]
MIVDAAPPTPEAVEVAWRRVQLARHPQRPRTLDLMPHIFEGFFELHGDRAFGDDAAIVGGPALLDGRPVMVIGHQKGTDTESNILRNFGSPHPEGFRKAQRLMRLADKLGLPIVTFLDTAGAFPGPAAEERGQAEAIASRGWSVSVMRPSRSHRQRHRSARSRSSAGERHREDRGCVRAAGAA